MLIGIGSYTLPWAAGINGYPVPDPLMPADLLRLASDKGLKIVQIGDNMPLHTLNNQELDLLKQTADALGISIEVGARRLSTEHTEQYISIAERMGSAFLRMVIDDEGYEPSISQVKTVINNLLPALEKSGIVLAIENHDRFSSAHLKQLIDETSTKWVGICLDTANSIGAGEGIRETVSILAPYTVNLHVKDVKTRRIGTKMGFTTEGVAAGEGQINIGWVIEQLKPYRRCHTAILEQWPPFVEDIEKTIVNERRMADKSIRFLKECLQEKS